MEESLENCPPIEYEGGTFLGRPDTFVRYNPEDQPRDKSNDIDHYHLMDAHPPIASFDSLDPNHLRGQSGFNRWKVYGYL